MVMRDRNSPSIVMWSIGNEIPMRRTPKGIAFSKQLADYVRALDPMNGTGRAVTSAYPGVQEDTITDQFLAPLDVAGYNYGWPHYAAGHARVPSRVIAGTESFPMQSFQTWKGVTDNAFVIGLEQLEHIIFHFSRILGFLAYFSARSHPAHLV